MYSTTSVSDRQDQVERKVVDLQYRIEQLEQRAAARRAPQPTPRQPLLAPLNAPGVG